MSKTLKAKGLDLKGKEIHHWNYNKILDVFILNPRAHKLIHKYILYDEVSKMFFRKLDMSIIDTKQAHFNFIKDVFIENNVNYEIDVFPIPC